MAIGIKVHEVGPGLFDVAQYVGTMDQAILHRLPLVGTLRMDAHRWAVLQRVLLEGGSRCEVEIEIRDSPFPLEGPPAGRSTPGRPPPP